MVLGALRGFVIHSEPKLKTQNSNLKTQNSKLSQLLFVPLILGHREHEDSLTSDWRQDAQSAAMTPRHLRASGGNHGEVLAPIRRVADRRHVTQSAENRLPENLACPLVDR